MAEDADLATVIALERRLLDPAVRLDRDALEELIHESFSEFGASGRVYDRESIVNTLLAEGGPTADAFEFHATRLGPDAVLVTYRTDPPSLRTSVWVRGDDGAWRIVHHHGTATAT